MKALPATAATVEDILRGTTHALTIFKPDNIASLSIFLKRGKPYLTCYASGKDRLAKSEEIVRQLYVKMLIDDYGYPAERIAIEKPVHMGSNVHDKPADIVIWDKDDPTAAYIIIECKKPRRSDGLEQLKSYCNAEGSPIGVWTNGGETIHLHRRDPNYYRNLPDIPRASQTLSELLDERWTLDDLAEHNVLVKEQTTLKKIILDMENLVLANAGVDAFEEVFKLIYAKLYDEAQAAQRSTKKRSLRFRGGGATPSEFKQKINDLFDKAKARWPGVFLDGERIDLTPEHLATCGSYLENVKLFNSNLQVIDEAFEYLSVEVGKGKKGQYLTPRHVIDMAVKMLNPNSDEYIIDYFDFDVLLTNPPFAGDIRDSRILHQFDLAKKANGKWQNKVGRDVLFIQRNLEFLKPGGRMAIVLPQGRLNNVSG